MLATNGVEVQANPLDPRGKIHIPIGIANTVDTLKTFVEAEGDFSPGFGSYGIYFWAFDPQTGKLTASTMDGVKIQRGLNGHGYLIPWTSWNAGDIAVKTEVCEVKRPSPAGEVFVVGSRVHLTNQSQEPHKITLYVALRPLGAAGWAVKDLTVSDTGDALLVNQHPAIIANQHPTGAGVLATDTVGDWSVGGKLPTDKLATSPTGDCSGALQFEVALAAGETRTLGFICPVLPGRRAVGHQWDGVSEWAQFDLAKPNPDAGGVLQPDPGLDYYRSIPADTLFAEADTYWKNLVGKTTIKLPDPRWAECLAAITGHVAMAMNEGAPDVSVVNYNVFNRDGVYVTNILQKAGQPELAAQAIDYFLAHPFNGRVHPEADNPGQVLWIMGEHWLFTRDRQWLTRIYPAAQKLAAMIQYYRTTPGPHWVNTSSLEFGAALPVAKRQELKPGSCDGYHPEYTEAFDIAGLRGAVLLAEAMGHTEDAAAWLKLADSLFQTFNQKFGDKLPHEYGSYSVLWPCHLYPYQNSAAYEQFKGVGQQQPAGWRYFPLATAHQGLLTGNREAGYATLNEHLKHEQMQAWYAFDEGGKSGSGGWGHVRTTWNGDVAMPHGWAIAEVYLLLRDSLMFEDGERLVLLPGVVPEWFTRPEGMTVEHMPTHFGSCSLSYAPTGEGATLTLSGPAMPPDGFVLRLPQSLQVKASSNGHDLVRDSHGDFLLPAQTRQVRLEFNPAAKAAG